jgi:phage baseplate assembly protein W
MDKDNTRNFLGNGWNYPPAFDHDDTPTRMAAHEENIRQSLWTLLSTSPGERVHRYDYGCPLQRYAFEVMDISRQTLLRNEIEQAVIMFEPRVELNRVDFDIDETKGVLHIILDYTIRQTNRRTNMVYPFYLKEGTDLIGL